ncbi:ATP-grasp domain-containing protein [Micromonospora sp. HUAS LYJ1]|uniref:ATP-grasp domain-containing protein n=1 Tax=Micromonospora sp. HUAS LYJ1 TaxID=3061626 RepID=UPI002670E413|nr:ATP-grasp domain-containing protein [Micromonospora sp. HUAS LYJ1]WKU06645.1 ATP-grasp domain-containing protein [Micromonospora sp. HUAS LYJ1]
MLLIVPADPLRPRRPDPHFAAEAQAAREAGHPVAVVDHDALAAGRDVTRAVAGVPAADDAVYRGWMLSATGYAGFAGALRARQVTLRTDPDRYRRAHELPGWYATAAALTPESRWTVGVDRTDFDRVRTALGSGPAVLRDWTKSAKHHWHEACFVPELADGDAAWRVATRLCELRDDDVAGGFVLRRFEPLSGVEIRTWWVDGRCVLTGPHPDTPTELPDVPVDLGPLAAVVTALDLPFVTADLAWRADGRWRLVEIGDGQVSDRPSTMAPQALIAALG